ncbi:uncharacterized protein [Rutidosis leptorrhynchoides]|uniref:uncharacterized protein n=1 Tax=Rutidosis leptorrhynchoides TaxID=125765 RepID=UPI003A99D01F
MSSATEDTLNSTDTNSINHPLFLHQNDNPSIILISKKLTGSENYDSWKRSMMIALNAKNKLKIITNEYPEPAADSNLRPLWERNNDMVISWILNTVTDEIINSLNFINSASKLWHELQEHYSQIDGHRIYQLANDISQLKQNNCTIEVYYHKLKGLYDETDALEAPYMCNCLCTCENGRLNGAGDQRKRLIQFLMGLDESYSSIRGQILLMQPLPTIAKTYGMIKQEEKQREGILPKPAVPAVMSTFTNNYKPSTYNNYQRTTKPSSTITERKSSFKPGVKCTTCFREGHTSEECYKNVGYPPGHPLHGKFQPKQPTAKDKVINSVYTNNTIDSQVPATNQQAEHIMTARMDQLQN